MPLWVYLCTYFCCQNPIYPKVSVLSFHISVPKLCTQYISIINYLKNHEQAWFLPLSIKYPLIFWMPSSSLSNDPPIPQATTRLNASSIETNQYLIWRHLHQFLQIIHHQTYIVLFNCYPPPSQYYKSPH